MSSENRMFLGHFKLIVLEQLLNQLIALFKGTSYL